jgi:hypothetical protein
MPGTKKPCLCSKDKPNHDCCGRKVFSLDQVRWRHAGQELRRSLGDFADQPAFAWEAARAQDLYLGCMDQHLIGYYDDFTMERCFEWFIFDYKLSNGKTVLETFKQEKMGELDDKTYELAKAWANSRISLYEVTSLLPGEGLVIKELLGRGSIRVRDLNAALEIQPGNILLMRVLKVGEEYEFSTNGLALPSECKEELLKKLHQDRQDYYASKGSRVRGWRSYLKDRAHQINAFVLELSYSEERPQQQQKPEKFALEHIAVYSIQNWQDVLKKFDCSTDLTLLREYYDPIGNFRQATAVLLGRQRGENPLRIVMGHLFLTTRYIVLTCTVEGCMNVAKEMCLELFKDNIVDSRGNGAEQQRLSPQWPEPGYAAVADQILDGLQSLGYGDKQQMGALQLWYDYCTKEQPVIRKTEVWVATVIYTFGRLEKNKAVRQQDLAGQYEVASSTISAKFKMICQALRLAVYDKRYTVTRVPGKNTRQTIF